MARHTQLAYAAAMMALRDAGLQIRESDLPSATPVVIGVSTSAMDIMERVFNEVHERGFDRVSPVVLSALTPQAAANVIADRIGVRAHASTLSSACPSGLDAVALAASIIRCGEAELALAGGALWSAGIAARAGARAANVGGDAKAAAREALPGLLRDGSKVSGDDRVRVRVWIPRLIPFLPEVPVVAETSLEVDHG